MYDVNMAVIFRLCDRTTITAFKSHTYGIIGSCRKLYVGSAAVTTGNCADNGTSSEELDTHILLEHLNTASPEEIAKFRSISLQRAMDIVDYRQENGRFQTVSDITKVTNIGSKTVAKIIEEYKKNGCCIPQHKEQYESRYKLSRKIMYPAFNSFELPESAVAFNVQMDAVYWIKMTKDFCVIDWSCAELGKYMHRKYDHVVHLTNLWRALQEFPQGSLYLMEESVFVSPTRTLTSSTLNLARLDSMLTLALNLRHHGYHTTTKEPPEQKVHRIKTAELARYFGLLVGGEKVSSLGVALDIIKGRRKGLEVSVSRENYSAFMANKWVAKEQLSNCLLQVTMLYELLLEQDKDMDECDTDSIPDTF